MLSIANHARILDAATPHIVIERGVRLLHIWKLAATDAAHCSILLDHLNPAPGARILDAGCGVGEVARLMREQRPDLDFTLLNISQAQLDLAPPNMPQLLASFDDIPAPDESFDAVMFNHAICHAADWLTTFREAARVLRPGGRVLIYDMERQHGDNHLLAHHTHSTAWPWQQTRDTAALGGFGLVGVWFPEPVDTPLRRVMGDEAFYTTVFNGVRPMVMVLARDDSTNQGAQP